MKRTYLKVNFHINQKVKPHRIWRRGGPSRMIKFVRGNPFSEKQGSAKVRVFCAPLRPFPNSLRVHVGVPGWGLAFRFEEPRRSAEGCAPPRSLLRKSDRGMEVI